MDQQKFLQLALHELESGAPAKCLGICDEILAENPGLIQALYLRGCAALQTSDFTQAASDLDVVFGNHPEHLQAAFYLGRALRAVGRFAEALAPLEAALGEAEFTVSARYELATCLSRLRRRPEAIDHYCAILALQPDHAQVAANLSSLLERENRLEEAEYWIKQALQMSPDNETAQMTRATLDRRSGQHSQASERLRGLIPAISDPVNRSIAWNQLGQCLEGQEEWDEAFNAFSESNQVLQEHYKGAHPDPRSPHGLQTLARIQEWLAEEPMSNWNVPAAHNAGGIAFFVGFPRSGTTLLDRMLSVHPEIEVLEEKSLFSGLHQHWSEPGTLESLADVSDEQISDARDIYQQAMSRHRQQPQRSLVIDKLPLNLAYLFLIYRLFPDAPVIILQRHPLDVCISSYFQAFELQASMAYFLDLKETVQYYDAVMQVAALSRDQVGNPTHELQYEHLVAEPKAQLQKLTSFLGLEWHEPVLEFWKDDAASDTPSYQQVSQPLYGRSIGRWQHYSEQLEPHLPILQPWVERLGYSELTRP